MKQKTSLRIGLVVVALLALSSGVWWVRGGAPQAGVNKSAQPAATAVAESSVAIPSPASQPSHESHETDATHAAAVPPPVAPPLPSTPATAPQPAAPLPSRAEGIVAPVTGGVTNRYTRNEVLDERTSEPDPSGQYERVRIVKTSMKYPLVRVEDRFQVSGVRFQEAGDRGQEAGGRGQVSGVRFQGAEVRGQEKSGVPRPESESLTPDTRHLKPSSDTLLSQTAMVADHVTLKVKEGTTEAQLAAYVQAQGGTILRKLRVPGPGTYLVQYDKATVDTVPNAVAALSQPGAPADYVNPDYVVYALDTTPNDPLFNQLWGMNNTSQIASTGTVASATNTVSGTAIAFSPVTNGVTGTLYYCGLGNPGDFPAAVSNNIALIQRGTLTFADKAANAKAKGAKAVIVYNNSSGAFSGTFSVAGDWLPTLAISDTDGAMLLTQTNTSVTVTINGCKPDADIDAPEAWDVSTGSTNVIVGVIDTGVDYNHPDLRSNMWVNPAPGSGGYTNDLYGYDFINNDGDPMDDFFHGTHCAGTIGGVGNNGVGVAGVCWKVRIMALKFLGADGSGNSSDAMEAVYYATAHGAKLTSNSWGGGGFDQGLHDAIANAGLSNILFVAAAGNSSGNNDASPTYPGSYDCSNIIAVAATDNNDLLATFSCYGQNSVDLGAPGVNILSTYPTYMTAAMTSRGDPTNYNAISGTSMATPHVAGACALMAAAHPELSALQIRTLILAQTDQIPALAGKCVTGGRLNIGRAIVLSPQPVLRLWGQTVTDPAPGGNGDGRMNPGETGLIAIKLMNASTNAAVGVTSTLTTTNAAITIVTNSVVFGSIPGLTLVSGSNAFVFTVATGTPPQQVLFELVTTDGAGNAWTNLLPVRVRGAAKISGTVRYDGAPGIGFRVYCSGQDPDTGTYINLNAYSDLNGKYSFDVLDGSYSLYSYWSGNQNIQHRKNVITPPDATNVDFEATTVFISGRVTDARTGNPQTNATVDYYVVSDAPDANDPGVTPYGWKTYAIRGTTTVDTNGNYTMSTVMMTTSIVSVTPWAAGYTNTAPLLVTVPNNATGVNFAIAAPDINIGVTPAAVSRSVKIGTVVTQTLVIANSGGASMPWTLWQESDEAYQAGTQVRNIPTTNDWSETYGIACDASAVCLADTFNPMVLYRHNPANGALLESWSLWMNLHASGGSGLDWDGVNFLVVDAMTWYKDIRYIDPATHLTVKSVPVFKNDSSYPSGGVYGGGYLWLISSEGRIVKADPRTGVTLASFAAPDQNAWGGIEYFSGALWVVDGTAKNIVKVSPTDGRVIRKFATTAPYGIQDLAKDRAGGLWLLDYNNWDGPRSILARIGTAAWLSQSASAGTVAGGGSNTVQLTFNSATAGLGVHTAMVSVATSDPDEPEKLIPVLFTVTASQSPVIDTPASATPNPVTLPATAALTVAAHDPDGDPLVFTWSQVSGPGTATFTPNGTAASANSVAGFSRAGTYVLRVTAGNSNANETATSDVTVYAAGIETDIASLTVPEGSNAAFRARLVAAPPASTTVTVARVSGDADITVSGGSTLVFDGGNWNAWQTVTLAAAADVDIVNGSAAIALSADGFATANVTATEQDAGTTLNVLAGMGGTVSPAGPSIVTIGSPVTVSAAANSGRYFARWVCTEGSVVFANPLAPTTTVAVAGAATIRANFGPMSGTVKSWGYNECGQLGDGTTTTRYAPITVLYGGQPFTNVTAIAVGDQYGSGHTLALRTDSNVWAWGYNGYGELGIGDTNNRANPVKVTGISNVAAVAAGYNHSVALDTSSNVWTWGRNSYGQLGDGTTSNRTAPWRVTGVSNVVAIVAGNYHTLVLDSSSNVWGWGYNAYGQIGDGTTSNRFTPVRSPWFSNATAIASMGNFTLALKSDGSLWICGTGGGFPTDPAVTPQQVAISNIVAFSAGGSHSLALKNDGSLWAWGYNNYSQLGDGNLVPLGKTYPPVQSLMSNAVALAAGSSYSLTLDGSGGVWGWGYNYYGQTGNGTGTTTQSTPAKMAGSRDYVQVAAGNTFSAAIQQNQPYISVTTSVSTVSVPEGGTNTFQVKLSAQPWTNVTVTAIRESGDGDISVSAGTNLTFTTNNWNTYQTVTLAAAEDADASNGTAVIWLSGADFDARVTAIEAENDATLSVFADANGTVSPNGAIVVTKGTTNSIAATPNGGYWFSGWSVLSGSPTLGNINAATTTVVVTSNATIQANFVVPRATSSVTSLTVPEGGTNTFLVTLNGQPFADTAVSVTWASGDTDITVQAGGSLTFTATNWYIGQTVTLAAAEDNDASNGTAAIWLTGAGLGVTTVTVTEAENDTTLTVNAGPNGTVSPSGAVVVTKGATNTITATPNGGYWFTSWSVLSGSPTLGNANAASTTVVIASNATVQANFAASRITSSVTSLSVPEGGMNTFQVALSGQPATDTVVTVSRTSGDSDISVQGGGTLTFAPTNWTMAQTVTLAAAEDLDASNGTATITCSAAGLSNVLVTATEADNELTYRMRIGLGGYTNRAETLTNFPVLVVLSNNVNGSGFNYAGFLSASGYDLRFTTDSAGTNWLNHEIESWDMSGASYVWVQVPAIPGDGSGAIWARWGDLASSNRLACTTNGATWANGYVGVWHFGAVVTDSTTNRNHATGGNAVTSPGAAGTARYYSNTWIQVTNAASLNPAKLTVSAWYMHDGNSSATYDRLVDKGYNNGYTLNFNNATRQVGVSLNNNPQLYDSVDTSLGVWHYAAGLYDGSMARLLVDGIQKTSQAKTSDMPTNSPYNLTIGMDRSTSVGSEWFQGWIDEVRVSSVGRSTNWVWAEYLNMASNAVFNRYGALQAQVVLPAAPSGLTATASGTNRIELAWADNASLETGYVVDRSLDSNAWVLATLTAANATNYSDSGLTTNTLYYYRVAASNAAGLSAYCYASAATWSVYEQWRRTYFTAAELTNSAVSGDNSDRDNDGMFNLDEYLAGTDPTNPVSRLVLYQVTPNPATPGEFLVTWQSATGRVYTVLGATNLSGSGFDLILRTNIPATPMVNVYTDTVQGAVRKFYRVKLE